MRNLPNLLTLCNLVCGCIAVAFSLDSQPFVSSFNDQEYWVVGTERANWGALFILLAAIFDVLDGLAARVLNVFSPIGKDLDSLADIVSFGVAPSMILYKMLWASYMSEPYALDVNMLAMVPAFLLSCAGAVRLARFNQNNQAQKNHFSGMPIPAAGLFVAALPLINFYQPGWGIYMQNKWAIYSLVAVLSWLMLSRIRFIKLLPADLKLTSMWRQAVLAIAAIVGWFVIGIAIVPVVFFLYIILSIVSKPTTE